MSDLPDFLLARIAEEETLLRRHQSAPSYAHMYWDEDSAAWPILVVNADHMLAEREAKRRIVDWAAPLSSDIRREPTERPGVYNTFIVRYPTDKGEDALRMLALPYADHPDYREEWRP